MLGKQIPAQSQARGLIWDSERLRKSTTIPRKKTQGVQAFTHKKSKHPFASYFHNLWSSPRIQAHLWPLQPQQSPQQQGQC